MNSLGHNAGEFSRLKRILIGDEQQVLSDIEELVRNHDLRVGSDEALQHSVADILANSLREADVKNHRELASAIAPVILAAIRREIRNASDEVVDAMYPIMGRLIRAYVASAIRDFVEQTNRTLEGSLSARFIRLRIKSLITRTPYRTLLIREGQLLRVASIYLIERNSGTLLEAWNADPTAPPPQKDEHLVGGMLTAITNFAAEALSEHESELKALDLGEARVFIRASAGYLIAVKSVGKGTRTVRRYIDTALTDAMESLIESGRDAAHMHRAILANLAEKVTAFLIKQKQPPVLALSVFLGLFLLGGLILYQNFRERATVNRLHSQVSEVIDNHATLQAFPLKIDVMRHRNAVSVAGLVPSAADRDLLIREASARLDPVRLEPQLVIVPPQYELQKISSSIAGLTMQIQHMEAEAARMNAAERAALRERIAELQRELGQKSAALQAGLEELHRITQDPLLKLSQWVAMHAIFFADEVAFRDRALAISTLSELRDLLALSEAKVRVIGYTDPTGTAEGNDALAKMRAEKVAAELERLGVSRDRLKVLGRPRGILLSYDKGPFSSNRRVEFEISYIGEPVVPKGEPLSSNANGL